MIDLLILTILLITAAAGGVLKRVAASVRELRPTLLTAQSAHLRGYEVAGALLSYLSVGALTAWAVFASAQRGMDATLSGIGAGFLIMIALLLQAIAQWVAQHRMDVLARPFLGDAAAFLPLMESPPSPSGPEEVREEAVEQMVQASEKAGLIESDEREMITGVMGLDRTVVREIMVPRIDVVGVDVEAPFRTALDILVNGSHSRIPVYEESLDHVVGLLYSKDLLKALSDGKTELTIRSLLRPAHFVPESKPIGELLQELQASKVHMSVVVDEYGGTAGIATIEDILEEIVGEIQDEYDIGEEPLIEQVGEAEAVIDARVSIADVNKTITVSLPDESDTLGGLVYERLQKIAKVGDQVLVDGVTISVLSVIGRRIKKVRVSRMPASDEEPRHSEEKVEQ